MRPLFTNLLVTDQANRRTEFLQVQFSRDFLAIQPPCADLSSSLRARH
jgi:hypothetical protein